MVVAATILVALIAAAVAASVAASVAIHRTDTGAAERVIYADLNSS